MSGLMYAEMKTERAETHLNELHGILAKLVKAYPYTITREDDVKNARHIVRIETKELPNLPALLIGEFAYCLRSGLDQLAWQLALLHTKRPRTHTSFPIYSALPKKGFVVADAVKDIPPAAVTVIESLQPYNRGLAFKDDPLWILNELCITDKHMIVPIHSTEFPVEISGVDSSHVTTSEFEYGTEFSIPLSEKDNAHFDPGPMKLIFGEPIDAPRSGFTVEEKTLTTIHNFVRDDVIPRFASFFP